MRYFLAVIVLVTGGVFVRPVRAGPVDTPIPVNLCGPAVLKLALVANGVGTDNVAFFPTGDVETLVVCHHTGPTGAAPIDVVVELFTAAGAPPIVAIPGFSCALGPGASASFMTQGGGFIVGPYIGFTPIFAGPQVPLGSLRVLSTNAKQVACDVTVFDSSSGPFPQWAADVTVTKSNKSQKGD